MSKLQYLKGLNGWASNVTSPHAMRDVTLDLTQFCVPNMPYPLTKYCVFFLITVPAKEPGPLPSPSGEDIVNVNGRPIFSTVQDTVCERTVVTLFAF